MGVEGGSVSRRVCKERRGTTWGARGADRTRKARALDGRRGGRSREKREWSARRTRFVAHRSAGGVAVGARAYARFGHGDHSRRREDCAGREEFPLHQVLRCFARQFFDTWDEFPRLPKHAAAAGGLFRKRLAVPAQCGRRHGDGGGADAPQGGAHSGPARGVFPRAVPPARAGARARGGGTRGARRRGRGRGIRRCSRAGATRGPGARARGGRWGGSPGRRRGAPVDSGARRVPEAHGRDRRQGTRGAGPNLGRNHRSNRTFQKRVPFFFLSTNAANQPRSSPSPHAPPAS